VASLEQAQARAPQLQYSLAHSRRMLHGEVMPCLSCPYDALVTEFRVMLRSIDHFLSFQLANARHDGAKSNIWHFDIELASQTDSQSSAKAIS
jgi:hypothetical protein